MTHETICALGIMLFVVVCFGYVLGYGSCAEKKNKEIEDLKRKLNQNAT
jgi:hypothetical protein